MVKVKVYFVLNYIPCHDDVALYFNKHHAMKTRVEVELELHAFLNLALDKCEWLLSSSGRFTLHWIGGCVRPIFGNQKLVSNLLSKNLSV
jgi:hypothetical protein